MNNVGNCPVAVKVSPVCEAFQSIEDACVQLSNAIDRMLIKTDPITGMSSPCETCSPDKCPPSQHSKLFTQLRNIEEAIRRNTAVINQRVELFEL